MGDAFDAHAELAVVDETHAGQMEAPIGFRNIAVHSYQNIGCIANALINSDSLRGKSKARAGASYQGSGNRRTQRRISAQPELKAAPGKNPGAAHTKMP